VNEKVKAVEGIFAQIKEEEKIGGNITFDII
jgi:hypothetical protein